MDFEDLFERRPDKETVRRTIYGILALVALAAIVLVVFTMFCRVDASEQGIVLRFGKHVRTIDPGLQMKLPWPIEQVYTVPVKRVQTLEFGFQTEVPGRKTPISRETRSITKLPTC